MASKSPSVYLLAGPERGERDEAVRKLKAARRDAHGELDEHRFYAFETPLAEVISLLQNGSLFSSHTWVLLNAAEELKKKADIELIRDFVKNANGDSTLVLVSDETKVEDGLKKAVEAGGKEAVRIFWELDASRTKGWLLNKAQHLGMKLSADAADFMLELVDNSTDQLGNELEKLALYFGTSRPLTQDDLETYLSHTKEESVFSLFEALTQGRLEGAVEVLEKLLWTQETDPIGILAGLIWQFRNLQAFKRALDAGQASDEAFLSAKIRTTRKGKAAYGDGHRRWSAPELEAILCLLAEWDYRLRAGGSVTQKVLLEMLMYYILARRGQKSSPLTAL